MLSAKPKTVNSSNIESDKLTKAIEELRRNNKKLKKEINMEFQDVRFQLHNRFNILFSLIHHDHKHLEIVIRNQEILKQHTDLIIRKIDVMENEMKNIRSKIYNNIEDNSPYSYPPTNYTISSIEPLQYVNRDFIPNLQI